MRTQTEAARDAFLLLQMLKAGVYTGMAYDGLRICRNTWFHSRCFRDAEDLGFWICVGLLYFDHMLRLSDGRVRVVWIAVAVAGGLLYEGLLSCYVVRAGTWILGCLMWPVRKMLFGVSMCIKWLKYHGKRGKIALYGHLARYRKKNDRGERKHNGESRI